VTVTFAGSRGRVESQLVPEAGYELDTFAISGFPRRLGLGLVRAVGQALRAPFACSRILTQRRPDVVLGAGGYVAGPMVLAARVRGIPAALTEADAHLGLANRLAAPLARRVFLAYAIAGRDGTKYRVVGRPVPSSHLGADRAAGRRLTMPVTVVQQDWGAALGFDAAALWKEWTVDLDHRTLDAGHFMAEEAPADVVGILRGLLAR